MVAADAALDPHVLPLLVLPVLEPTKACLALAALIVYFTIHGFLWWHETDGKPGLQDKDADRLAYHYKQAKHALTQEGPFINTRRAIVLERKHRHMFSALATIGQTHLMSVLFISTMFICFGSFESILQLLAAFSLEEWKQVCIVFFFNLFTLFGFLKFKQGCVLGLFILARILNNSLLGFKLSSRLLFSVDSAGVKIEGEILKSFLWCARHLEPRRRTCRPRYREARLERNQNEICCGNKCPETESV